MNDNENYTYESERIGDNKSTILLIIALVLAAAVTIWIIFAFDRESGPPDHLGQQKPQPVMVANVLNSCDYTL